MTGTYVYKIILLVHFPLKKKGYKFHIFISDKCVICQFFGAH